MLIGLAVHEAICAPDLVSALANAVFGALIHVDVLIWLTPSSSPSIVNDGLILGAHSRHRMFTLAQTTCRLDAGRCFLPDHACALPEFDPCPGPQCHRRIECRTCNDEISTARRIFGSNARPSQLAALPQRTLYALQI